MVLEANRPSKVIRAQPYPQTQSPAAAIGARPAPRPAGSPVVANADIPGRLVREGAGVQQGMHKPQPFPAGISGDPAPATRQAATGINRQAGGRTGIFSRPLQAQLSPLALPLLLQAPKPSDAGLAPAHTQSSALRREEAREPPVWSLNDLITLR
jgi:hypothetical protein